MKFFLTKKLPTRRSRGSGIAPEAPPSSSSNSSNAKHPQAIASAAPAKPGSMVRIRLSIDVSSPPSNAVDTDPEIVVADRTDTRTATSLEIQVGAIGPAVAALRAKVAQRGPPTVLHVHRTLFRLTWLAFLGFHVLTAAYLLVGASMYTSLARDGSLEYLLAMAITVPVGYFPLVAFVLVLLALLHIFAVAHMLGASLVHRQLAFRAQRSWKEMMDELLATIQDATEASAGSQCKPHATEAQSPSSQQQRNGVSNGIARDATLRMVRVPPRGVLASLPWPTRLAVTLHSHRHGQRVFAWLHTLLLHWDAWMGRDGVLGIDSELFDVVVLSRKCVAVGLQTCHAYWASLALSHRDQNKLLVFSVVAHCWATPAIHFYCQRRHAPLERVLYLATCFVLNVLCFVVAPLLLLRPLSDQFSAGEAASLAWTRYVDDCALVRAARETQFLLLGGWADVGVSIVPQLILSQCMSAIKPLLERASAAVLDAHQLSQAQHQGSGSGNSIAPAPTVMPPPTINLDSSMMMGRRTGSAYSSVASVASARGSVTPLTPPSPMPMRSSLASAASLAARVSAEALDRENDGDARTPDDDESDDGHRRRRRQLVESIAAFAKHHVDEEVTTQARQFREQRLPVTGTKALVAYAWFFMWGIGVLTLQARSTRVSQERRVDGCELEVRPWSTRRYGCAVLTFDCAARESNGSNGDLDAVLLQLHRPSLATLVIAHCAGVEMPSSLQLFPRLVGVKLYNSTLHAWPKESAVTQALHPQLQYVSFVRTNLSAVPDGLLQGDLPASLRGFTLVDTNLTRLPDDIGDTWSKFRFLLVEHSALTKLPALATSMARLETLSVAWNAISEIPDKTFATNTKLATLSLAGNALVALPAHYWAEDATESVVAAPLRELVVSNTEIAELPVWTRVTPVAVQAENSPLCTELVSVRAQIALEGSLASVSCSAAGDGSLYPLTLEDSLHIPAG